MVDTGKRKRSSSIRDTAQSKRSSLSPPLTPSNASVTPDVPTSFEYTRPLPTVPEPQRNVLPKEWYQSIAESGLMEESLRRSREKWLSEDDPIFEKYWTKPLKKRVFNEKTNPPKESMLKIGECELLIEPHLFEIRLYGVREPQTQPVASAPQHQQSAPAQNYNYPSGQYNNSPYLPTPANSASQSQVKPVHPPPLHLQHALANSMLPQAQRQHPTGYPQLSQVTSQRPAYMVPGGPLPHPSLHRPGAPSPYTHKQPVANQVALSTDCAQKQNHQASQNVPVQTNGISTIQTQGPPTISQHGSGPMIVSPSTSVSPELQNTTSTLSHHLTTTSYTQVAPLNTSPAPAAITPVASLPITPQQVSSLPPPPIRPDPVIQLLATKASTDPSLKALMRTVAGGNATQEELKIFQQHIDELTPQSNAIKARHAEEDRQAAIRWHQEQQERQRQQLLQPQSQPQGHFNLPSGHSPATAKASQSYPYPLPPNQASLAVTHLPVKSRSPHAASVVPKIVNYSAIVFEFVQSDYGDRFLFPRNSILEFRDNGCTVLVSFLILKTVKNATCSDIEYYEPMTVYFRSQSAKLLEHLQRIVSDPETVKTYMKEIMIKRQKAPKAWPVYRLKRATKSGYNSDREEKSDEGSWRASITPAPTRGLKDITTVARRRKSSTPMTETKHPMPIKIGPRVKVIKKPPSSSSPAAARLTASSSSASASRSHSFSSPAIPAMPTSHFPKPTPPKPKLPRSRKGRIADPTKSCHICKTSKTSLWRKAEVDGEPVTVCNACGIKWKTHTTRQAMNAAALAAGEEPRFGEDGKGVVKRVRERQGSGGLGAGPLKGGESQIPIMATPAPPPHPPPSAVSGFATSAIVTSQPQLQTQPVGGQRILPPNTHLPYDCQLQNVLTSGANPHQTSYPLSQPPPLSARLPQTPSPVPTDTSQFISLSHSHQPVQPTTHEQKSISTKGMFQLVLLILE